MLFDGVCNLCNSSVTFVIDRDPQKHFKFASLQSEAGKQLLQKFNIDPQVTDSIIYIEDDKAYVRSTAVLRAARHLSGPFRFLNFFLIIPSFIRDTAYDMIAKRRYKIFGKLDSCRVQTPELKARFLD